MGRSAWARLIRKIYEIDPLVCPQCLHTMRIIALIENDPAIKKILKHLGLRENRSHSPPPFPIYEEIVYRLHKTFPFVSGKTGEACLQIDDIGRILK